MSTGESANTFFPGTLRVFRPLSEKRGLSRILVDGQDFRFNMQRLLSV